MLKPLLITASIVLLSSAVVSSQTVTTVTIQNDASTLLRDFSGTPLSQGTGNVNGDGAMIQLGYYQSATAANNFGTGTDWVALTSFSPLLPNTTKTTIGDTFNNAPTGAGAGVLSFPQIVFVVEEGNTVEVFPDFSGHYQTTSQVSITTATPPNNQILSIRFFDSNAGTGMFNAVSADTWLWKTPDNTGAQTVPINLSTSLLEWQDSANPFKTSIPATAVPEPTTIAAGMLCLGVLLCRAWQRRNAPQPIT